MSKVVAGAMVLMLTVTGCELLETGKTFQSGAEKAKVKVETAMADIDKYLPAAIETAADKTAVAEKWGKTLTSAAKVAGAIPGPQQPYAEGIATILAMATGVMGWLTTKLKRKAKANEAAVDTLIKAAEHCSHHATAIKAEAMADGTGETIKARYNEVIEK